MPDCLITLQRKRGALGYFWASQFTARSGPGETDEIALNPEGFHDTTEQILSTLAHEMAHLWQHHFGTPSRSGYHNKEWATQMIAIGLIPSDTGQPGGKQTGQRMDHYIDPAGAFAIHTETMIASGFVLRWQAKRTPKENGDAPEGEGDETEGKGASVYAPKNKIKYTCATCGQNAWAKPGARLICGDSEQPMIAQ